MPDEEKVMMNRAPVLTLWASVVAERMGYDRSTSLTLGKAVAGLNAQSKGRMLGIYGSPKAPERKGKPRKTGLGEDFWIELCDRGVPAKNTPEGIRAVVKDKPISPAGVQKYLEQKFAEDLPRVRSAMESLAGSFEPEELCDSAYPLYERFRPSIPPGKRGWGAKGELDLDRIRSLAVQE
jgi:hypothetical protein